jgi:hypothetical protein
VWPVVIVKSLTLPKSLLEINIAFIAQELIELLLVGAMRSLDLPIQLRRPGLDVDMADVPIGQVPAEQGLELVTAVGAHSVDGKWERRDDVVHEGDGVLLRVATIDSQRSNARGIVNGCVLVTPEPLPTGALERQEFHIDLHVMTRHLFLVTMGMHCAPADPIREVPQPVAAEDPVDRRVSNRDAVISAKYHMMRAGPRW